MGEFPAGLIHTAHTTIELENSHAYVKKNFSPVNRDTESVSALLFDKFVDR